MKQVTERNIKKQALFLCFVTAHVIQIETLKNVKYVPAKELVPAKIRRRVHRKIGNFLPSHIDFLFIFLQSIGKWKRKTQKWGATYHLRK